MKRLLFSLAAIALILSSCQKEIDWSTEESGGSEGDILVKAIQITPSTNDTNIITFQRDASKRLLVYTSAGKVSGIVTNIKDSISRLADGKISRIVSKSSLAFGLDSIVYQVFYVPSSTKLNYVIDTQYTFIGAIMDSIIYQYNGLGQVTSKETYTDLFGLAPSAKETYTYDGYGNVTTIKTYSPDGAGGYDLAATTTNTFIIGRKAASTLGEESFIVLGATNVSVNDVGKIVTNNVASGTTYTTSYSQQKYNNNDRPKTATLTVNPQPPGYTMKLSFYYQ